MTSLVGAIGGGGKTGARIRVGQILGTEHIFFLPKAKGQDSLLDGIQRALSTRRRPILEMNWTCD